MKRADEIKKGWECCQDTMRCEDCPYDAVGGLYCDCTYALMGDAFAYIQQLEQELAAVKRERDAAVYALESIATGRESKCAHCVHSSDRDCFVCWGERWQWRGVCPENTED